MCLSGTMLDHQTEQTRAGRVRRVKRVKRVPAVASSLAVTSGLGSQPSQAPALTPLSSPQAGGGRGNWGNAFSLIRDDGLGRRGEQVLKFYILFCINWWR